MPINRDKIPHAYAETQATYLDAKPRMCTPYIRRAPGCLNLQYNTIHNITYNNNQIKNMTVNQWRRLVQKKVNDTVNKEIMEESSQKIKLHNISGLMQS